MQNKTFLENFPFFYSVILLSIQINSIDWHLNPLQNAIYSQFSCRFCDFFQQNIGKTQEFSIIFITIEKASKKTTIYWKF